MDSVIQVLSGLNSYGDDEVTLNGLAATEPAPLASSVTIAGFGAGTIALFGLAAWFFMRPSRAHFDGLGDHILHFKGGGTARVRKPGRNKHFKAIRRNKSGIQLVARRRKSRKSK